MGTGFLQVQVSTAQEALPIPGAEVIISLGGKKLYTLTTNEEGYTKPASIDTPDKSASLDPNYKGTPYASCDVRVSSPGLITKDFRFVEIFDTVTSVLPVNMTPDEAADYIDDPENYGHVDNFDGYQEITLPEHALLKNAENRQEYSSLQGLNPFVLPSVVIPLYITVHLGSPTSNATNVTVPFRDYIKNVASHEIYPTWDPAALEANIYCQISLVLNRVYTEWYRSRGYYYDITNHTGYDQYFVYQGNIFSNISNLVDQIFNRFIQREGHKEPFYAEYCNGTTATCPGLSQWGSQHLAQQGYNPLEILRYYYPDDIQIVETNNMQAVQESYPGYPLSQGTSGGKVRAMQDYLNRIRVNYPNIPQINPVDGVFGTQTYNSVRQFQSISSAGINVTGVVDRATWYRIVYFYTAVKKLAELQSEGQIIGVGRTPPTATVGQGARGRQVGILQFLLNFIGDFYPEVPPVIMDYDFGAQTLNAVRAFQRAFGITNDGFVGRTTWNRLYQVYWNIMDGTNIPTVPPPGGSIPAFPGTSLRLGSSGTAVRQIQSCLNGIAYRYPSIPKLTEDGQFGSNTQTAVIAFQRVFGLAQDGIVGPVTWNKIAAECAGGGGTSLPPYPGTALQTGSSGASVTRIQNCLNNIQASNPSIPRLTVDGQFGSNTRNAVIAFQRIFGLTQDGIVGPITWNRIMAQCSGRSAGLGSDTGNTADILSDELYRGAYDKPHKESRRGNSYNKAYEKAYKEGCAEMYGTASHDAPSQLNVSDFIRFMLMGRLFGGTNPYPYPYRYHY